MRMSLGTLSASEGRKRAPSLERSLLQHVKDNARLPIFALCMVFAIAASPSPAQQLGRQKLPVLGKIGTNAPTKGAFTGIIQTLDRQSKVLEVSSVNGRNTAIFPITKKVKVSSIEGHKLKLTALTPGTNIVVNYEQHGDRRTVQEITVIAKAPTGKKPAHTSS